MSTGEIIRDQIREALTTIGYKTTPDNVDIIFNACMADSSNNLTSTIIQRNLHKIDKT